MTQIGRWLLYPNNLSDKSKQFPYRLFLEETPGSFRAFEVQDKWPGGGKKIFCNSLGTVAKEELPADEYIECCLISSLSWYGKKLMITLDRPTRKRCWFIFLKKEYKSRPGEFYEQVFWITRSAAVQRRAGTYIPTTRKEIPMQIWIDNRERYPYRFAKGTIEKKQLPLGDYALIKEGAIIALAERKTLGGFLSEIPYLDNLRANFQELAQASLHRIVLFDSPYSDFLNPRKIAPYPARYIADILADLQALYPMLPILFFDNRKLANEWLYRWFRRLVTQTPTPRSITSFSTVDTTLKPKNYSTLQQSNL